MNIQITSRHAKMSQSLQDSLTEELEKLERFHDKITSCHVVIDNEHSRKTVEIVMNMQNHTVSAKGKEENLGKAIDDALAKTERQLKKINEKIKDHKAVRAEPEGKTL